MLLDAGCGGDGEAGVGDAGAAVELGVGFGDSGIDCLVAEGPLTCTGFGPTDSATWL